MANWNRTSASQVKTYQECNRKWFFERVIFPDEDPEESVSLSTGTDVHASIEDVLNNKVEVASHPLLAENSYIYSVRASGLELRVEWEFLDTTNFKVPAKGFIDLVIIDHAAKTIQVVDHKTTKNWRYVKKPDALRKDAQCILYLMQALTEFGPGWAYSFSHHCILTAEAAPEKLVTVTMTVDEIIQGAAELDLLVAGMLHASRALDHTFVDYNTKGCWAYGKKCKFWDYCKGDKKVPSLAELMKSKADTTALQIPTEKLDLVTTTKTLYVDCLPKGDFTWFSDWILDLVKEYEKDVGENYMVAKFNEGAKIVAVQAHQEVLKGTRKLPDNLVVRSSSPIENIFDNLHCDRFDHVVRGIR